MVYKKIEKLRIAYDPDIEMFYIKISGIKFGEEKFRRLAGSNFTTIKDTEEFATVYFGEGNFEIVEEKESEV